VAFGHTNPQATGYLRAALERLRQLGYIDNFGPIAYRLSDRGVYSLCWDERLPARVEHPRDYYPPPRKKAL
jgi:DNA-binding transcriptional regulator PaaX